MTGAGRLVEVQGTAEGKPFTRAQLDRLMDVTADGVRKLTSLQRETLRGESVALGDR
jgi:ribonuclease PH